jgi:hypothetical protein
MHVLEVTHALVVYYIREPESGEIGETDLYMACSRRTGRFVEVGSEEPNVDYGPPEDELSDLQVQGNWLVITQTSGASASAECGKYSQDAERECPTTSESLIVIDVASAHKGRIRDVNVRESIDEAPLSPVLISGDGAVAWLETTAAQTTSSSGTLRGCVAVLLHGGLECKPRLVAEGVIPTASLRLMGTTLTWTSAGQPQSSVL